MFLLLPFTVTIATAQYDWSSTDPKTIPLVKGNTYLTSQENLVSAKETGWLLVDDLDRKQGYVPLVAFKARKTDNRSSVPLIQDIPNVSSCPAPSKNSINEQMQPISSTPVTDLHGNPIALPHPLVNCDKSNIDRQ